MDKSGMCSILEQEKDSEKLFFSRTIKKCLTSLTGISTNVELLSASINKQKMLVAAGFSNGVFCIFDIPALSLLQNFSIDNKPINSINFNSRGDWLSIGCGRGMDSQLLVWEWQSESHILKQQSHSQTITAINYSPDGSILATGGEDGKVKLWNCSTSFCIVTFTEHETGVTDICFTQNGKAVLSSSLEGSIRAHDLKRYRNFRTLVAPKQTQLHLLCADSSGDIVAAASKDLFEIYVWSFETSEVLDILTGHSNLINGLIYFNNLLCSVSLDKTMKIWNITQGGNCLESVNLLNEGLDVKYSPNGSILAVLCYDSNINLFNTLNTTQIGIIETKLDIDAERQRKEKIKKINSEKNKTFTCIDFSPNGQLILAGGQSNVFCLYSVVDRIKLKSFKLSSNFSLDGVNLENNYRKMTEFGNLDLFDLTDSDEEETNKQKKIRLPGTRHTDLSERFIRPTILMSKVVFSPTGLDFAVACTEGVCIYSLSKPRRFDPLQLESNITPKEIINSTINGEYVKSLSLALRLNDNEIIERTIEAIPVEQLRVVINELGLSTAEYLLYWLAANKTRGPIPSKHFHFYLIIIKELLYKYSSEFKLSLNRNNPSLTAILELLNSQNNLLIGMCTQNLHSLEYLIMTRNMEDIEIIQS
ncbi:hypothetical protein Mgra_00008824 [Meloidogyne graminicola]|uniref:Small-subunit processome Utp12 domain-containing protein n=1 Tax=Meloidogyne graminicola TaxID=189291 RepID=A0A8S9ZEK6_9BILA|nr:hypothetical protein Mgra_00008824 [Meloidogyne graminicola]